MEILSARDVQDYHSVYLNLYDKYRTPVGENVNVNDDIIFELELIKQVEINIDYILFLISKLHGEHTDDKEIQISIQKAVNSSPTLRNKKDLITDFIDQLTPEKDVNDEWKVFVKAQQRKQLDTIIEEEKLKSDETYEFMHESFKNGIVEESGTAVTKILPPMSLFSKNKNRGAKKQTVLVKLKGFFEKFFDISGGDFKVDK